MMIMTIYDQYNELHLVLKKAFETYFNHPTPANKAEWKYAEQEFSNFCVLALEYLMEDYPDVLNRVMWED